MSLNEWLSRVMHYTWIAARNAGRPHKTEDLQRVLERAGERPAIYTAADLLRVAEAVREACAEAVEPRFGGPYHAGAVRAVDVAEVVRRVTK